MRKRSRKLHKDCVRLEFQNRRSDTVVMFFRSLAVGRETGRLIHSRSVCKLIFLPAQAVNRERKNRLATHCPNRCRYSIELKKALTISASI